MGRGEAINLGHSYILAEKNIAYTCHFKVYLKNNIITCTYASTKLIYNLIIIILMLTTRPPQLFILHKCSECLPNVSLPPPPLPYINVYYICI